MAIFSVYNYDKRMFDYYQTSKTHSDHGTVFGNFRSPGNFNGYAAFPELLAVDLPRNAFKSGSGHKPIGVIARIGSYKNSKDNYNSESFSDGSMSGFGFATTKASRKGFSFVKLLATSAVFLTVFNVVNKSQKRKRKKK